MKCTRFSQYRVPKNHGTTFPDRFVALDSETWQKKKGAETRHTLRLAWIAYSRLDKEKDVWRTEYVRFQNGSDIWKHVESLCCAKKPLWVFAHNAFFDITVTGFWTYFGRHGWKRSFWYDKGLTFLLTIKKGARTIKVVSTTNYFQSPLSEMGVSVSLPKIECDVFTTNTEELSTYCKRDTEIVVRFMQQYMAFIKKHDLGRFSCTRASQAMHAFRHRFLTENLCIHSDDNVRALESAAYMGGRCEAFFIGSPKGGPFTTLDVNSMYPYIMQARLFPARLLGTHQNYSLDRLPYLLQRFGCVAQARIKTDVPAYAIHYNGKTVFPVGSFTAMLCTSGTLFALQQGHLESIDSISYYSMAPLFASFVAFFYRLRMEARQNGDRLTDTYCKLLLNSLYGKYGQYLSEDDEKPADDTTTYSREEVYDAIRHKKVIRTTFLGVTTTTGDRCYSDSSFYAIAAHVTEYARFYLWDIINSVGRDRVLYCDTDSIKVRSIDVGRVSKLLDSTRLGALKVESESEKLTIYGVKDYTEDGKRKLKGVPKSAHEIAPGTWKYDTWLKQTTHLRENCDDSFITRETVKRPKRTYDKGRVLKSGIVRPLRLHI